VQGQWFAGDIPSSLLQNVFAEWRQEIATMKRSVISGFIALLSLSGGLTAADKMKVENLPAPVQKTVNAETATATLVRLEKEREGGKTVYEVETKVNGKSRDLMVAADGKILSVEEETAIEGIPAAAREAILKKAAGAKIKMVETVTKGSDVSYEATIIGKSGKTKEFGFNADGTPHKE
jgi:uncharacterized membrane protein YkoI